MSCLVERPSSPMLSSPIPWVLDLLEDDEESTSSLEHETPEPVSIFVMQVAPEVPISPLALSPAAKVASPLGIKAPLVSLFHRLGRRSDKAEPTLKIKTPLAELFPSANSAFDKKKRLGISKISYDDDDDDTSVTSIDSSRIGISPPKYDQPEFPSSPQQLFRRRDERADTRSSPTPSHISCDESSNVSALHSSVEFPQEEEDNIRRLLHPQTASGHFLVNSSPVLKPSQNVRFFIKQGKTQFMPKYIVNGLEETSTTALVAASTKSTTTSSTSTVTTLSLQSSVQSCATPFKIFLLLMHPTLKIFELVQIVYSPDVTTVGDLLHAIPENASETTLGVQEYTGLCRPKERHQVLTPDQMASAGNHDQERHARVQCGEILVPVAQGYTSEEMAKMSKAILKNSRVTKLLKRSNPLAPNPLAAPRHPPTTSAKPMKKLFACIETIQEEEYCFDDDDDDELSENCIQRKSQQLDKQSELEAMEKEATEEEARHMLAMLTAYDSDGLIVENQAPTPQPQACDSVIPITRDLSDVEEACSTNKKQSNIETNSKSKSSRWKSLKGRKKRFRKLVSLAKRPMQFLRKSSK